MSVSPVRYAALTEGAVAFAAAGTAKCILGCLAAANSTFKVPHIKLATTGKTASDDSVLIEVMKQSTSSPAAGTATGVTMRHISGATGNTAKTTGFKNYTAEPTTLVPCDEFIIDPNKMVGWFDFPLGREIESNVGTLIVIRATIITATTVSGGIRAVMHCED